MRYRRLLKMVLGFGLLSAACGFVGGYLWDYGFSAQGISRGILVERGAHALAEGMLMGGFVFSFPVWLALERFPRPAKRRSTLLR